MTSPSDTDLLNIFWVEVGDYLQTLNNGLLQIETGAAENEAAVLGEMNRVAHSMKGAARAVGIGIIETIAHYLEEIFGAAINDRFPLTPNICDLLYDAIDLIQNVVNGVENPTEALASTLARLEQTIANHAPEARKPAKPALDSGRATIGTIELGETGTLLLRPAEDGVRVPVSKLDRLSGEISELLVTKMHGEERQRDIQRLQKLHHRWQREWRGVRTAYIRLARRLQNQTRDETAADLSALLDFLETNQHYLAEANRHIAQLAREVAQYNAQVGALVEQLQDDVGRMRLVPFESSLGGFQRMVRDLARDTGKNIYLDLVGSTVELDKTTLDALREPIMHLLRNAVDHGIEPAAERARQGKPETGRIQLAVEQRGKEIVVRVSDDGRGLDAERIGRAAQAAGLIGAPDAGSLSEEEVFNLIYHPGLTTSESVTRLSGRGMGLDIVRTRVESLRGRVSVQSAPGQGTTFSLSVPLVLSRLSCVVLQVGDQDFAVPSARVSRMLKIRRDQVFTAEGRDMVQIHGQPMPVLSLHALLGFPPAAPSDEITLLVLTADERQIAFQIDALQSEQELVLKPLGREVENIRYVSGAALLGSGEVIIVLDANDLIRSTPVSTLAVAPPAANNKDTPAPAAPPARQRVLIVDDSITTRTLEKHILETAGFEVSVAIDGVEAWTILADRTFDIVIADVEMPNMDGLELTRRIKNDGHLRQLPVVLLTSLSKPEQREAGLRAGADAYLMKSQFDQAELLRVIQAVM